MLGTATGTWREEEGGGAVTIVGRWWCRSHGVEGLPLGRTEMVCGSLRMWQEEPKGFLSSRLGDRVRWGSFSGVTH